MDYAPRVEKLRTAMMNRGLDGLAYGTGANFQYFTGLPVNWQRDAEPVEPDCLFLLAGSKQPIAILTPAWEHLEDTTSIDCRISSTPAETTRILRNVLEGPRLGTSRTAAPYLCGVLEEAIPGSQCEVAEDLGEALRLLKEPREVEILKEAAGLTDAVMGQLVDHIQPGVTQQHLEELIAEIGLNLGAEGVSFSPTAGFVKSGTEPTPDPFVYPRDEGLVRRSSVAFDFGLLVDGYCSDFGRSFYCGKAPDHIEGAYRALQEAQCHLINRMVPGELTMGEMFPILEAALDDRGYGDHLRARLPDGTLGHHIGVDLHENPWIRPGCDVKLEPGMVMALEPKLWMPGEYYLRVEDMVLVTEEGAQSLTSFDREMFELPTR